MLDLKFIRENKSILEKVVADRQMSQKVDLNRLLELDNAYRQLLQKVETHRALRNRLSEDISKVSGDAREKLISEATHVKAELQEMESEIKSLENQIYELHIKVPNIVADDVPYGKDDSENIPIKKHMEPTIFDFAVLDHVQLGAHLDLIDTDTSAIVSGSRFCYLKNELVLMQFALLQYVFNSLINTDVVKTLATRVGNPFATPFVPVLPPDIVRGEVAKKMDRLDPVEDRYYYENDEIMFAGSAEHTLGPMFMDQVIDSEALPLRYIGYSTAFRREAGSYGRDTTGIFRRHQFDKAEMEIFSLPEYGMKEHELCVEIQHFIVSELGLPHQVVLICTGDMGKPDFRQVDIECWLPGQNTYRETHTADYMTDYQARRLNTRYKKKDGESGYVHMNDATAVAFGRLLIAIMENYQTREGFIRVPDVLKPYMGNLDIIKR